MIDCTFSSSALSLQQNPTEMGLLAGDGGGRPGRRPGVEIRRMDRDRGRLAVHQEHRLRGGRQRRRRRRRR